MKMPPISAAALATAAVSMALSGAVYAAPKTKKAPAAAESTVKCEGINSCKGTSACKTARNNCKGQNSCKGQGWVSTSTADECKKRGGSA